MQSRSDTPIALITGASRGLGAAVARALTGRGWAVIADARGADELHATAAAAPGPGRFRAVPGDVTDPRHRRALVAEVLGAGGLDLLLNNASTLGASPQPRLDELGAATFRRALEVNVLAPTLLTRALLQPLRARGGTVVDVTSDAATEAYPGWGAYAASKAALDRVSATLAAEEPELRVYAFDPGDMHTAMHQAAFPDEDISDRPEPSAVVPALLRLLEDRPPSGRYRAGQLLHPAATS